MRIDEAILIMENERPHCGDKLTFTEEERYEAYTWAIGALKELSSAQPEIIRCKDCKYYIDNRCYKIKALDDLRGSNDFCSYAERRTNG